MALITILSLLLLITAISADNSAVTSRTTSALTSLEEFNLHFGYDKNHAALFANSDADILPIRRTRNSDKIHQFKISSMKNFVSLDVLGGGTGEFCIQLYYRYLTIPETKDNDGKPNWKRNPLKWFCLRSIKLFFRPCASSVAILFENKGELLRFEGRLFEQPTSDEFNDTSLIDHARANPVWVEIFSVEKLKKSCGKNLIEGTAEWIEAALSKGPRKTSQPKKYDLVPMVAERMNLKALVSL